MHYKWVQVPVNILTCVRQPETSVEPLQPRIYTGCLILFKNILLSDYTAIDSWGSMYSQYHSESPTHFLKVSIVRKAVWLIQGLDLRRRGDCMHVTSTCLYIINTLGTTKEYNISLWSWFSVCEMELPMQFTYVRKPTLLLVSISTQEMVTQLIRMDINLADLLQHG